MSSRRTPAVLIVDDEPEIVLLLTEILGESARLVTARNANEALAILTQDSIDVALVDKNLPDRSGLDIAEEAGLLPFRPEIVLMTGYASPESARKAVHLGVYDYIEKPFSDLAAIRQVVERAALRASNRRDRLQTLSPRRHRILVVDDDEIQVELVRKILSEGGCEVVTACEGRSALAKLQTEDFDAAVVDVFMPEMGGIELLQLMANTSHDVEVVIATAAADLPTAIACLRAGAFDFVQKPLVAADLRSAVGRAVATKELRHASALYRASQAVFSVSGRDLAVAITEASSELMGADDALLMLPERDGKFYVARSFLPEFPCGVEALVSERLSHDRAPAILDRTALGPELGASFQSVLLFPMLAKSTLMGAIVLCRSERRPTFRRADLQRASVLASMVTLALENRRLQEHLVTSERLAAIGQISAGILHEINNPAAYALSNIEHIKSELESRRSNSPDLASLADAAADALDGLERIREITADMRGLSRIARAEDMDVFDLNDAIRSATRIAGFEIRKAGKLVCDLSPGLYVRGSLGPMSQVFVNLLVNGAHAIAESPGPNAHVEIRSGIEGGRAVVRVSDSGAGIPESLRRRVFEPFFTTKSSSLGTGLGLSICREIVEQLKGEITVESSAEHLGAVFVVRLPLFAAVPEQASESPHVAEPARPRVAFVDDEPGILRCYQRLFEKEYEVFVASNGLDAMKLLDAEPVHLVVCDLMMPGMTGMELFGRITSARPELASRFLFVSGSPNARGVREFLSRTTAPVVEKPWLDSDLRRSVSAMLRRRTEHSD